LRGFHSWALFFFYQQVGKFPLHLSPTRPFKKVYIASFRYNNILKNTQKKQQYPKKSLIFAGWVPDPPHLKGTQNCN